MFDFQKAINGEPIWFDGKQCNLLIYDLEANLLKVRLLFGDIKYFKKNGKPCIGFGELSTTPPKKKVNVTAYVYKDQLGDIFFGNKKLDHFNFLGEISGEVEI